jgi:hypothetical protein
VSETSDIKVLRDRILGVLNRLKMREEEGERYLSALAYSASATTVEIEFVKWEQERRSIYDPALSKEVGDKISRVRRRTGVQDLVK